MQCGNVVKSRNVSWTLTIMWKSDSYSHYLFACHNVYQQLNLHDLLFKKILSLAATEEDMLCLSHLGCRGAGQTLFGEQPISAGVQRSDFIILCKSCGLHPSLRPHQSILAYVSSANDGLLFISEVKLHTNEFGRINCDLHWSAIHFPSNGVSLRSFFSLACIISIHKFM